MYLVYKTDVHHSYASRDLIGVADNAWIAICIIAEQVSKENESLSEDQAHNLQNIKQTQGYSGEGEFQFEEVETNVLL